MNDKKFTVTVTPKFPSHSGCRKAYTVEVWASDKKEANQRARYQLESEGCCFTKSDACTFKAEEIT